MTDLAPEDAARADFYALLARLWHAGPDAGLLAAIAAADEIVAEGDQAGLADAWLERLDDELRDEGADRAAICRRTLCELA